MPVNREIILWMRSTLSARSDSHILDVGAVHCCRLHLSPKIVNKCYRPKCHLILRRRTKYGRNAATRLRMEATLRDRLCGSISRVAVMAASERVLKGTRLAPLEYFLEVTVYGINASLAYEVVFTRGRCMGEEELWAV